MRPDALAGWDRDDLQAALAAFRVTMDLLPQDWPRPAEEVGPEFFVRAFEAGPAFPPALLTGYYEPELEGRLTPDARFRHPLCAPPAGWPEDWQEGQVWASRAEIEEGRLLAGREILWLDDALEAFLVQVQGSCRVRLADGTVVRLGYAGKNGHPYSSIGKILLARGDLDLADVSVDAIRGWAARHPGQVPGLLRQNASFVFFRLLDLPADRGPIGAMGRSVTAGRTVAVDPGHVTLGAPVWMAWDGQARLCIAQDRGSAILGPGRADLYCGGGAGAGAVAGRLKASAVMVPLQPRSPA